MLRGAGTDDERVETHLTAAVLKGLADGSFDGNVQVKPVRGGEFTPLSVHPDFRPFAKSAASPKPAPPTETTAVPVRKSAANLSILEDDIRSESSSEKAGRPSRPVEPKPPPDDSESRSGPNGDELWEVRVPGKDGQAVVRRIAESKLLAAIESHKLTAKTLARRVGDPTFASLDEQPPLLKCSGNNWQPWTTP